MASGYNRLAILPGLVLSSVPDIRFPRQAYLSDHNKAGFEHWAKLNNLKEAARTFNYLSEHNLLNYEDFKNHVADSADAIQATESKIQSLNKQLDAQRLLQKRCDVYRHCRTVLLAEKDAPDKKAYQKQHQAEYQLLFFTQLPDPLGL